MKKKKGLPENFDPHGILIMLRSIDAEESLICSILVDNEVLNEIIDIIQPDDFYKTAHQKIFRAIKTLFEKHELVDLVTLTDFLEEKKWIDEIGGTSYLLKLVDFIPIASNVVSCAKIIREKASLRRLITVSYEVVKICIEDHDSSKNAFEFAERSTFDIPQYANFSNHSHIKETLKSNFTALSELKKNKGKLSGVPTGFKQIDSLTSGLQASDLIILAARSGMGKTALALNIARNAAVEHDVPVLIFSLEMSKESLSMRILCAESRITETRLRDGLFSTEDWNKLSEAAGILEKSPIFLDDSPYVGYSEIRSQLRRMKKKFDIGLVVIDYLQLLQSKTNIDHHLQISEISRALKGLAKELKVPVLALLQLNRQLELRNDKRPRLADLREFGSIEQDADLVFFIYRDEVYHPENASQNSGLAEVILAKHRNGPIGKADLVFKEEYTRFENLDVVY